MSNLAPVLNSSATPTLGSVLEGTSNPTGINIADLVVDGSITDANGAIEAIAITSLNTRLGAWQYSTNGGANWLTIRTDLVNSSINELALHLGPNDKIRLIPFGELNGSLSDAITFRAWDQSNSGTVNKGSYATILSSGGTSAYSASSNTASMNVTAVNAAPTFAPNTPGTGKIVTDFGRGSNDGGRSVSVQADGKLVVAGYTENGASGFDFALVRYNTDGTLDTTFNAAGTPGRVVTTIGSRGDQGYSVNVQSDGKLVVAGFSNSGGSNNSHVMVRYNSDGTLDLSFNAASTPGKVVTDIDFDSGNNDGGVTVQADGKLVVAGFTYGGSSGFDFVVVRYNADGTLDKTFNAAGTPGRVATYFINNSSADVGNSVTVQADGKLVVTGYTDSNSAVSGQDFAVVRYNSDGTLDTSFNATGTPGKILTDIGGSKDVGRSVIVQADGKIVVAGSALVAGSDFAIVRYNSNGTLDTSFNAAGTPGKVVTDIAGGKDDCYSIIAQADGKLVVVGSTNRGGAFDFAVVRYNADGALDTSFNSAGTPGKLVTNIIGNNSVDQGFSVAVQPDGKLVVAGLTYNNNDDFAVVRYNTDGSLDTSFGATAGSNTLGGTLSYTAGAAAVAMDSSVAVFDLELASLNNGFGNYSGASVTLARNGGANAQDVFAFNTTNALFTVSGANLQSSGKTFATLTNTGGTLSISFTSSGTTATQALVNDVLSRITYACSSSTPTSNVQINWTFSDGNTGVQGNGGALSVHGSTTVQVAALPNTPPTLKISTIPASKFEVEYNDERSFSTTFTNSLSGFLANSNDVDWYSVNFNAQGMQTVTVDTSTMNFGSWNIYWYDPSMQVMSGRNIGPSADGAGSFTYEFPVFSNGTYYLRVKPSAPSLYNGGIYNIYLSQPDQLSYTDTAAEDVFAIKTGILVGSDADAGTTLTYGVTGGTTDSETTVSKVGTYGTLTVNKASGAFTFSPNDAAIEALKASATETYAVSVSDGVATTTSSYTLTFTGADDPTSFSGATTGAVSEDGVLKATGVLTVKDRDSGDSIVVSQSNIAGNYGTFSIAGTGSWSYDLNNNSSVVQSLGPGRTVTDTFSLTTVTGAKQSVSIAVSGAMPTGTVTVSGSTTQGNTLAATNTLADPDGLGALTYQWSANGVALSGSTASTLLLDQSHIGTTITVEAKYTDNNGNLVVVKSSPSTVVTPNPANKTIPGTKSDDFLKGGIGNDTIDGGNGTDTASFTGKSSDYFITFDPGTSTFSVKDLVGSRDGTDRIIAIELLQFSDGTKQLATTDALLVGRLNQALFGKAPSSNSFNDSLSKVGSNGNTLEWVKTQASAISSLSDAAYATLVLKNLSITNTSLFATPTFGTPQQAYDALHSAMTGYLGLVGNASRGIVAAQLANIIAGFEGETVYGVYGGAAKAFNQQVGSNIAHSINTGNTTDIVVVPVMATGSVTATGDNFSYMLAMGNYGYQISGFGAGDKIVGPAGVDATLSNSSTTDGVASLQYTANGQTMSITLTGLTTAQDAALTGVGAFNTLFGVGTLG